VIVDNGKHEVRGRKVDVKSAVKREEMTPAVHIPKKSLQYTFSKKV
jgi:hypothetical protein